MPYTKLDWLNHWMTASREHKPHSPLLHSSSSWVEEFYYILAGWLDWWWCRHKFSGSLQSSGGIPDRHPLNSGRGAKKIAVTDNGGASEEMQTTTTNESTYNTPPNDNPDVVMMLITCVSCRGVGMRGRGRSTANDSMPSSTSAAGCLSVVPLVDGWCQSVRWGCYSQQFHIISQSYLSVMCQLIPRAGEMKKKKKKAFTFHPSSYPFTDISVIPHHW